MTCSAESHLRERRGLERDLPRLLPRGEVVVRELLPGRPPGGDEPARRPEDRVAVVVGTDRLRRSVRDLGVRPRVAQVAHGAEVQHGRAVAARRTQSASSRRALQHLRGVAALRDLVAQLAAVTGARPRPSPPGVGTLIPRPLSSHTKRSGSGSPWNVHCAAVFRAACARRVVQRRVAERAEHDRILRPRGRDAADASRDRSRAPSRPPAAGATRSSTSSGGSRARAARRPCASRRRSARRPPRRRRA